MNRFLKFATLPLLTLAVMLSIAGCKSNQDQTAATTSQASTPDQSGDPASANLAPVSTASSIAPADTSGAQQGAPPPDSGAYYQQVADQSSDDDDSDYGEQPEYTAPDPPPPLPDYDQPQDPGDGYIWTPGYWNYASSGYYWVPGVWVQAPYEGALWTPGYWGFVGGRYGFFHGYWGPHIGFYGGVNYGFGYVGTGYQGGYWNSGHFFYNRAVNNVNVTVVHNVYSHPVPASSVRVSFHGGQGGIRLRPRPAELAALREPHAAPMHAQIENEHAASTNRAQFAAVNHGRPASMVVEKPIMADHGVHPVAAPMPHNLPVPKPHGPAEIHPNASQPEHGQPARPEVAHPEPARPEAAPHAAPRAEEHPAPRPAERPAPQPERHSAPAVHTAPRPAERPAPQPAAHPAPHPAEHSAPATTHPASHPAQPAHPAPKPKPEKPL
ncbi:MAG: hypothetical protein ABR976_10555 [Terracidiphilus sp.]